MKKLLLLLFVLILIGGTILWAKGKDMREIRTEIEISAPPEKVWNLLTDIDHWHEWSPVINKSSGTASMGATLDITMMSETPGKDGPQYTPIITIFDAPKHFRWSAKMGAGFIMTNDKVFELEEINTGTRLIHIEVFSGMMVPLFWSKVKENVPGMLNSMNSALKALAEKNE